MRVHHKRLTFDKFRTSWCRELALPGALFVHGDDDRNVPLQQTTDLSENCSRKPSECEELIFPTKFMTCSAGATGSVATRATAEFFDRKLSASGERQ